MRKAFLLLLLSVPGMAHSDEVHLTLYGSGADRNPNRAAEIARANVAEQCGGNVSAVEIVGMECYGDGVNSAKTCIVHSRAVCTVERVKHFKSR